MPFFLSREIVRFFLCTSLSFFSHAQLEYALSKFDFLNQHDSINGVNLYENELQPQRLESAAGSGQKHYCDIEASPPITVSPPASFADNYCDVPPALPATPPPVISGRITLPPGQEAQIKSLSSPSTAVLQKSLSGDLFRPLLALPPPVLFGGVGTGVQDGNVFGFKDCRHNRDSYYSTVSSTGSPIVEEPPSPAPSQMPYVQFPGEEETFDSIIEVRDYTNSNTFIYAIASTRIFLDNPWRDKFYVPHIFFFQWLQLFILLKFLHFITTSPSPSPLCNWIQN